MAKTVEQFALAHEHLGRGNLTRARSLYRRILNREPGNAEAWHQLGVVAAEAGDRAAAAALMGRAIQLGGPKPSWCSSLGRVLASLGRSREAVACFRQALAGDPLNAAISLDLGKALAAADQCANSILALTQAVELDPSNPESWFHLGYAHYRSGEGDAAVTVAGECYERALELNPQHAETHFRLGVIRMVRQRGAEAIPCFRRAIELDPSHAEAYNNLGLLEQADGRPEAAVERFEKAIGLRNGSYYAAEYNLARAFAALEKPVRASDAYAAAVAHCPEHTDARLGLAGTLMSLGRPEEAVTHLRAAIELCPDSVAAHLNLSVALLKLGQWAEGWPLYEWRLRRPGVEPRGFHQPRWTGSPLHGERVLLHSEQGFGDTLQFARYVPLVRQCGGIPILECQPPLVRLMRTLAGVEEVIAQGDPLPVFDCHAPLLSLPGIFGTTPDAVASAAPYLTADPGQSALWAKRLADTPPHLRVGLTWAGNPHNPYERTRSIPLEMFRSLSGLKEVSWFNLQKDAPPLPDFLPMIEECSDFAENAAAVMNLDLVISVDTAMAHLAGVLGRQVWTLLPYAADWRWLLERSDTPWYRSMRLFRQPRLGDWESVLANVREELMRRVSKVR